MTFEYGPDRRDFWEDYVERAGWGIGSEDEYQRFLNDRQRLGDLFDVWSDPNADDTDQHEAYEEFWDIIEGEYGLPKASFDWHTFRELYPLTQ